MNLDLFESLSVITKLEQKFNESESPVEGYSYLTAILSKCLDPHLETYREAVVREAKVKTGFVKL